MAISQLLAAAFLIASDFDELKSHSLYLMQQAKVEESIDKYKEYASLAGKHDFDALQQLGLILLQKGIQSPDRQTVLMTLFGAGLSGCIHALDILDKGMASADPQMQLLSLHFAGRFEDDRATEIFIKAMSSEYLAIRMEAAFHLAQRKHPHAVGQIEGLMYRLPPLFKPYFPPLFALVGTNDATRSLRRLLEDADPRCRIESILQAAKLGRDDFLPLLRKRLSHSHVAELEATLFAIGVLKDSHSLPKLKKLAESSTETVRLAASIALLRLGDRSYVASLIDLAKQSNLFAISALGEISETEEILASLLKSEDLQVRLNAAIALLQRHDPRCTSVLSELLITDERGLAFHPFASVGHTLTAVKAVPSAELRSKDPTLDLSYSLAMREHFLREAMHLPEGDFLQLARKIFHKGQNDLVPTLISLLENLQTKQAIALLKEGANGYTPFIRTYCHLSLYRLKEEGPHEEYIAHWLLQQKDSELIQLRQLLPWQYRLDQSDYTLSPEETSRLLVETFLAIASKRDEPSITLFLKAMSQGNASNRYALMGLLMKATE